jgi:hypothetical protein
MQRSGKQSGFSAVAVLLILLIVAIIGGTGWYVMQANKNTDRTLNKAGLGTVTKSAKKTAPSQAPQADPTANWTAYSSKSGEFSLKYPSSWVKSNNNQYCDEHGFLLLGPNTQSVGHCQSDDSGQIFVSSNEGNNVSSSELDPGTFPDAAKTDVTVNGVRGERMTGTNNGSGFGIGVQPAGTKEVDYLFYANGRTYRAYYLQLSSYPNVLSDFDLMVTKTLKFSAQ